MFKRRKSIIGFVLLVLLLLASTSVITSQQWFSDPLDDTSQELLNCDPGKGAFVSFSHTGTAVSTFYFVGEPPVTDTFTCSSGSCSNVDSVQPKSYDEVTKHVLNAPSIGFHSGWCDS